MFDDINIGINDFINPSLLQNFYVRKSQQGFKQSISPLREPYRKEILQEASTVVKIFLGVLHEDEMSIDEGITWLRESHIADNPFSSGIMYKIRRQEHSQLNHSWLVTALGLFCLGRKQPNEQSSWLGWGAYASAKNALWIVFSAQYDLSYVLLHGLPADPEIIHLVIKVSKNRVCEEGSYFRAYKLLYPDTKIPPAKYSRSSEGKLTTSAGIKHTDSIVNKLYCLLPFLGISLASLILRFHSSLHQVLSIKLFYELLDLLIKKLWKNGLVHRDIKPDNVMVHISEDTGVKISITDLESLCAHPLDDVNQHSNRTTWEFTSRNYHDQTLLEIDMIAAFLCLHLSPDRYKPEPERLCGNNKWLPVHHNYSLLGFRVKTLLNGLPLAVKEMSDRVQTGPEITLIDMINLRKSLSCWLEQHSINNKMLTSVQDELADTPALDELADTPALRVVHCLICTDYGWQNDMASLIRRRFRPADTTNSSSGAKRTKTILIGSRIL